MTQTKEATADAPLYRQNAPQRIPLTLTKNGRDYTLYHNISPLTDERYLQLENEIARENKRAAKRVTSEIYNPKFRLWQEIVESREGYRDRTDWKESTHPSDAIAVIQALLFAQVLDESDTEVAEPQDDLYDDEALTGVSIRALQSGALLTLTHYFRQETKAEMDEFYSIVADQPNSNTLASAEHLTRAEKLWNLGRKVFKESDGYDGPVPVWHLAATTESFFLRQIGRMGKSLKQ
jgi:hypothetical protein